MIEKGECVNLRGTGFWYAIFNPAPVVTALPTAFRLYV